MARGNVSWFRVLRPDLAFAFTSATLLLALPVYVRVFEYPALPELARLVMTVQLAPFFGFAAIGIAIRRARGDRAVEIYWSALTVAAILSVLRLVQLEFLSTALAGWTWWQKAVVAAAIAIPLIAAVIFGRLLAISRNSLPAVLLLTVVFAVQAAGAYLTAGEVQPPTAPRTDTVIVIIFDELGSDVISSGGAIDGERFPNFAALAAEGTSLPDSTTNYSATCESVPSMLTGRFVQEIDCDDLVLSDLRPSLLSALATHYRVAIYEEVLRDCRSSAVHYVCRGIPYFVARYPHLALASHLVPPTVRASFLADVFGGTHTPYAFVLWEDLLADLRAGDPGGRAYFVHIGLPHSPYVFDEEGRLHHSPNAEFTTFPEREPQVFANYRRQSQLTDRLFGQLVQVLRETGVYSRSTIVVTGDHGPWAPPTPSGEISVMTPRVPVIIKGPSVSPGSSGAEYQHIDLTPTLLDILKIEPPPGMDGRSAFGAERTVREKRFTPIDHAVGLFRASEFVTYVRRAPGEEWLPSR